MTETQKNVADLLAGDLFHAKSAGVESIICLATAVEDQIIHSHDVCRGNEYMFDRATGLAISGLEVSGCMIDSVAPLPDIHHMALLGMDKRYRDAKSELDYQLTEQEKQTLSFVSSHYARNRLR